MSIYYAKVLKRTAAQQWDFLQFTNITPTTEEENREVECPIHSCAANHGDPCRSPRAELSNAHKSRRTELLAKRWLAENGD